MENLWWKYKIKSERGRRVFTHSTVKIKKKKKIIWAGGKRFIKKT